MTLDLLAWLRATSSEYQLEPAAVFRRRGTVEWPRRIESEDDLSRMLAEGGHLLPLPKEPAALANVLEVSLVEFFITRLTLVRGAEGKRGTERGYPDIELAGPAFGGGYHAVDVKVARRAKNGKKTKSRITLFTGNTYFRHPQLQWPGTFRPFKDYATHVDLLAIYTFDEQSLSHINDVELIVQPSWQIASKERSSTTREYIGAVMELDRLRSGRGDFSTEAEFLKYWRGFNFKIGRAVELQLTKLLRQNAERKP